MKQHRHPLFSTPALIGVIVVLIVIGLTPYFIHNAKARIADQSILPRGIVVGTIDAGTMNEEQLRDSLESYQQLVNERGIVATINGASSTLREAQPSNPDIPMRYGTGMITVDYDSTIRNAFFLKRSPSILAALASRFELAFTKKHIPISIHINQNSFADSLDAAFSSVQHKPSQADFIYNQKTATFEITPEKAGTVFDIESAIPVLTHALEEGQPPILTLRTISQEPNLKEEDIKNLIPDANTAARSVKLSAGSQHSWILPQSLVAQWITAKKTESDTVSLAVRSEEIRTYLEKTIAPAVHVEGRDPRFELKDGKIIILAEPKTGMKLKINESLAVLSRALLQSDTEHVNLPVEEYSPAPLAIPSEENIRELIAKAETDFKGSPKNRRANIVNGMSRINGILIQPGEEFSLLHYLEPIDDTTGFLPELVIKGNVTKPEFGGGLCQVSTTLFRAVAYAGLPVTQRRNHSYRVSYYEPPVGFDATIYSPGPDFKFRNDMPTPVLIQAGVKGTKALVTLWGSKDGRISEVDKPTVYNIRKPPETILRETTELKPGEKNCTEKAHSGADAYFERRVTYASGEIKKETFKSHYVVWPAVCYVGSEKKEVIPDNSEGVVLDDPAEN